MLLDILGDDVTAGRPTGKRPDLHDPLFIFVYFLLSHRVSIEQYERYESVYLLGGPLYYTKPSVTYNKRGSGALYSILNPTTTRVKFHGRTITQSSPPPPPIYMYMCIYYTEDDGDVPPKGRRYGAKTNTYRYA